MTNDNSWMSCTSCHAVVQLNATGICLGCQGGFSGQHEEDKYTPKLKPIEEIQERAKELEAAIEKANKPNPIRRKKRDRSEKE